MKSFFGSTQWVECLFYHRGLFCFALAQIIVSGLSDERKEVRARPLLLISNVYIPSRSLFLHGLRMSLKAAIFDTLIRASISINSYRLCVRKPKRIDETGLMTSIISVQSFSCEELTAFLCFLPSFWTKESNFVRTYELETLQFVLNLPWYNIVSKHKWCHKFVTFCC